MRVIALDRVCTWVGVCRCDCGYFCTNTNIFSDFYPVACGVEDRCIVIDVKDIEVDSGSGWPGRGASVVCLYSQKVKLLLLMDDVKVYCYRFAL